LLGSPREARLPGDLQHTTIGLYQIVERVGAGGMGTVYRDYQHSLDRAVAIKVLPQSDTRDASFYERFRREARATGKCL
jgi:serine/threonine protein kinase